MSDTTDHEQQRRHQAALFMVGHAFAASSAGFAFARTAIERR
jgi:hypothetical protein